MLFNSRAILLLLSLAGPVIGHDTTIDKRADGSSLNITLNLTERSKIAFVDDPTKEITGPQQAFTLSWVDQWLLDIGPNKEDSKAVWWYHFKDDSDEVKWQTYCEVRVNTNLRTEYTFDLSNKPDWKVEVGDKQGIDFGCFKEKGDHRSECKSECDGELPYFYF